MMQRRPCPSPRQAAERAAEYLFTNGAGEKADHLELDIAAPMSGNLVEAVRELKLDRDRLNLMYAWKPIESAPLDGTVVLGKLPDSDVPQSIKFHDGAWVIAWDNHYLSKYDQPTHWK